jgi:ribonucleoside-diphosphate reductase alpha chain
MATFSPGSISILEARYLLKDRSGNVIETPNEMITRVSKYVAMAEDEKKRNYWQEKFISIMDTLEFLPNSPTLMNAGKELGQLSACFLIEVEDDLSAILESVKRSALIHKTGGGTGIVFSKIRPRNSIVGSTFGVASGPVSFMRIFDTATAVIKQGGVRRGANLGALRVNHPDIEEFVMCKRDLTSFENFNISVVATDKFMSAVESDSKYQLHFKGQGYKKIEAKELYRTICESAWISGDPGLIFIDTANRANPTPWFGHFEGTNPCGEQPLLPYESCNLGSIDISKFCSSTGKIDYNRLKEVVEISVRFLDDVISVNKLPNAKIANKTLLTRKIGLGVMGYADLLLKMDTRYNSDEALVIAEDVMRFIQDISHATSEKLGKERGYVDSRLKRRNSTLTTIAPTGTLSVLAGCSSGIEPIFSKDLSKIVLNGERIDITSKLNNSPALVTAHEVEPEWHIKTQAAFQKYTDNAVSKTVNLSQNATVEDIEKIFMLSWKLGCKGITIFRDGSKNGVLVSASPEGTLGPNGEIKECQNGDRCII